MWQIGIVGGVVPKALITETDIPGLYNVHVDDGRELTDVTIGQLKFLAQAGVDLLIPPFASE